MSRTVAQFDIARRFLAGGVTSSTRFNRAIGRPMYFARAAGCHLWDLDGRRYIDLCTSHGATLLGHGNPQVRSAVEQILALGAACSYENELHVLLAQQLCEVIPCCELVRFTGSGTEATMHCLRLARAFTGRTKLLMFEGNFHGYHDQVLFAPSAATSEHGRPASPAMVPASSGLVAQLAEQLVVVPYNRPDLLEQAFDRHGRELAAAICEPVYFNAGCILPTQEFIQALRRLTREHGALLVFDEVLSAFRMGPGGAQEHLAVTPDLCTIGKAVGGGFPLSAFCGRREIMSRLMPEGDCQHSGTYNGHPVVVAAGLAAVRAYRQPGFYDHIHALAAAMYRGLQALLERHRVAGRVQGLGALFGIYFGVTREVRDYRDALAHDRATMLRFVAAAIDEGVYFHDYGGVACHHGFCAAMTLGDVDETLVRLDRALAKVAAER